MFFQISPVIHKRKVSVEPKKPDNEDTKVEILSLAPFTPNPKIVFDDVIIGTTQTRMLLIKNPNSHDVNLFIKKPIPEEINLVFSWTETRIESGSELVLEMVWGPIAEEACRHTFTLSDGKRINRDVAVSFKSLASKRIKATGSKKLCKQTKSPIKVCLARKTVSPTKKLKPQKKSPTKITTTTRKSAMKYPPYQKEQFLYSVSEYGSSKEQQKNFNKFSSKENRENMSPSHQQLLCNASASFTSPSNATFLMDMKNEERRQTYILNPMSERRETYTLQIDKRQNLIAAQNCFAEAADTFTIDRLEHSPHFSDSLESPNKSPILREQNTWGDTTPTLGSMLNRDTIKREYSPNFEYRLKVLENFGFSPAVSPYVNTTPKLFAPTLCSTDSKPPSQHNSLKSDISPAELFPTTNQSLQLNGSNETYTKINTSSSTYTKGNSSFETYIVGNLSTGTYVKDSSIGNIENLDVSPVSSRLHQNMSPVFFKPRPLDVSPTLEPNSAVEQRRAHLSSIAEESYVFSESSLKIGSKRKHCDLVNYPSKREKISTKSNQSWSKKGGAAFRIAKSTTGLNVDKSSSPESNSPQPLITFKETNVKSVIIQNPFLYAHIMDPFMSSQIYCNDDWVEQQEEHFKKWLNALLTPPKELNTKTEVDVALIWQECKKKEVSAAPTKETMSLNFHTQNKLTSLRNRAQDLFRSKEISDVLQKVCIVVETGKLSIREDKDLHLNLKLKSDILGLILSYNPLWLRIGLETIYNEIIPLKSNSDTHGLTNFLLERFLKDPHLIRKHKTPYSPKYCVDLKKFLLKKFLLLVYFLDKAKNAQLIQHDPCLFCKNAAQKESKLVLTSFARETLSAVGNITKYLNCVAGYVVTHVQSFIHEFDYAVKNLGTDLRDGVRLIRVMEIIQMRDDLKQNLRVPAISRLQKIHNVKLVFKSLHESGYKIQYEICAQDIVDGHREKTLSFLWQIIYKFEAPLMVSSATTIQSWFRSFPVMLKRLTLRKLREKRETAAKKIQGWYRRQKLSTLYIALAEFSQNRIQERKQQLAAIKIQSFFKMVMCRQKFLLQFNAITKLQAYAKGWLIRHDYRRRQIAAKIIQKRLRGYVCRKNFLKLRNAVILIQRKFKANQEMKKNKLAYDNLKVATVNIQRRYRANLAMRKFRNDFIVLKTAAIKMQSIYKMYLQRKQFLQLQHCTKIIQTKYRAQMAMKKERSNHLTLKSSSLIIQRRFRAFLEMNRCRKEFLRQKKASIKIQSFYRMYRARKYFLQLRVAVKIIQIRYRANVLMKIHRLNYLDVLKATLFVQQRFRANSKMKKCREEYLTLRNATVNMQAIYRMYKCRKRFIKIQKATKLLQEKYRAFRAMREKRVEYQTLRNTVLCVQRRFRANLQMIKRREEFLQLKSAAVKMQSIHRMYKCRKRFIEIQKATLILQEKYRALRAMRENRLEYQTLKKSVVYVQRRFRANQLKKNAVLRYTHIRQTVITIQSYYRMIVVRKYFLQLKDATLRIQRMYRAQRAMKEQRNIYQKSRNAVVVLQQRWRARVLTLQHHQKYLELKKATKTIQQRFRANKQMQIDRHRYCEVRSAAIKIQMWYKSILTMRVYRKKYVVIKKSALIIEERYLAFKLMQSDNIRFKQLKQATVFVQRRFKAKIQMRIERNNYLDLKSAVLAIQNWYKTKKLQSEYKKLKEVTVFIQTKFRANKAMKYQRFNFIRQRNAAIQIQQWYKATIEMKRCQTYYELLKAAVKTTKDRYKAKNLMERERRYYQNLRISSLVIQRRYRAILLMREMRKKFVELRNAAVVIQRRYRATKAAKIEKLKYEELKNAVVCVQRRYRAVKAMRQTKAKWDTLKRTTIIIQRWYRAQKQMVENKNNYQRLRNAAVIIQRRYRARRLMIKHAQKYQSLRLAVRFVQKKFRANLLAKHDGAQYLKLKRSVLIIQQQFRVQMLMKIQRAEYIRLKEATVMVQRKFRATVLMRKDRKEFALLKSAAISIQIRYRATRAMVSQKLYYKKLKEAVVLVQRKFRANQLTKEYRSLYVKLRHAAIVLQRRYRARRSMVCHVTEYSRIKWAALVIQRRHRANETMKKEMLKYQRLRHATFVIQRKFRAHVLGTVMRQWFLKYKKSIRVIQEHFRAYLLMKIQREIFLAKYAAVVQLQRLVRGYLVRKKYAPFLTPEAIEGRRLLNIQNNAAVKIQATWRGYSVRKSNIPAVVALRAIKQEKLNELRISVPTRTLAQRCEMAMLCMTGENSSLLMVIRALEDLDFITRHCRDSCIRLSMLLPSQLYIIISSAARSLPEMSACNMATFILINFCKYSLTRKNSWNPEYIDAVVNMLINWCDKEAPLFSTLCTLLWLFCHEDEWKKVILGIPHVNQRFQKIHTLVHRKQSMVLKSKQVCRASVFGPEVNMTLPTRSANWGLDYNRPNTFTNAVFALTNLMNILDIK